MPMRTLQRVLPSLLGLAVSGAVVFVLHGFTVDDALISARYATHIAQGLGHRFNNGGPITDGVTPLPWPYLLAPFAKGGPIAALHAAKVIGALAWLAATIVLATHIRALIRSNDPSTPGGTAKQTAPLREPVRGDAPQASRRWHVGYLSYLVAFATPSVGAWAVSGMETGLALSATTVASVLGATKRWRLAASLMLGMAGTLRPELMPYVLTLALGAAWLQVSSGSVDAAAARARSIFLHMLPAALPFVTVTCMRWFAFGNPAPLSVRAKPSDLQHGLGYALATLIIAGPPMAIVAPWAWRKLHGWPRWLLAAFAVHTLTCIAVGGDWMPMSRLFVPVLPSLAIVFAHLARHASAWSTMLRGGLCCAGQMFVFATVGPAAARVGEDRLRLVESLQEQVDPSDVIASVDIGWVGAAHRGKVVDLAGVTDPDIAALPGGHTSKRIPEGSLDARGVTHLLLLMPQTPQSPNAKEVWDHCDCVRSVEARICEMPDVHRSFEVVAQVRSTERLSYVLVRRIRR